MRTMLLTSDPKGTIVNDNFQFFENLTIGHTVVMGRNTFNSLLDGPLKRRCNIVLTRKITFSDRLKAFKFNLLNFGTSLKFIKDKNYVLDNYDYEPVFIIGGKDIFMLFEEYCDDMHLIKLDRIHQGLVTFNPSQVLWRISSRKICEGKEIVYLTKKY